MRKDISRAATFLYGKNSVYERLRHNPKTIQQLFIKEGFDDKRILDIVRDRRISCKVYSLKEFSKVNHSSDAQGVVAKIDPFKYRDLDELLNFKDKPTIIFLDNLYDPQNLGVILRISACFGNFAVVIPKHDACEVTDSVLHVACGGENFVPVCMVGNLVQALEIAKQSGYWIAGGVVDGGEDVTKTKLPFPLGIVMGSEGKGIRPGVKAHLDKQIYIPMNGAQLSLNVAVACAILCYETQKQRL